MIISGQHSNDELKILQKDGCGEERQQGLEKWDAYIVWDLDPICLTMILKFYNSNNYHNHVQLTWRNQIVSGKNIKIANGKPIDKVVEVEVRRKGVNHNACAYW
jgi:hypothetical protein